MDSTGKCWTCKTAYSHSLRYSYGCSNNSITSTICFHGWLSLSFSAVHDGPGSPAGDTQNALPAQQRRALQQRRTLLGKNFCDCLCSRRRDRYPYGVPVWHELGTLLHLLGGDYRADAGNGRRVCFLSRIS